MPQIYRAYLSSAPISNDGTKNINCLVVAVDLKNNLYLCRLGDKYWTRQHFNELGHFNYDEILFYNGSLIVMDGMSRKVLILRWFWS